MSDSNGIRHCDTFWAWMDLGFEVMGKTWYWRCPGCGEVVGSMPWNPPADTPIREVA